jgi:hypothetical protein
MAARIVAFLVTLLSWQVAAAQDAPTIRAHSRVVTIVDGIHVKKNYWYVMPEKQPEVYYVEIPLEPHTVTFTTDVESISFAVTPGSQHEFMIRLDDGVESRTLVRASFKRLSSYSRSGLTPTNGADTIPFTLGDDDV